MSRSRRETLLPYELANPARGGEQVISPSIQEVKAKHANRLLDEPGVVSVGLGLDAEGKPAIIVGIDSPHPETQAQLPRSLEGYPVITQIIGKVEAQ